MAISGGDGGLFVAILGGDGGLLVVTKRWWKQVHTFTSTSNNKLKTTKQEEHKEVQEEHKEENGKKDSKS